MKYLLIFLFLCSCKSTVLFYPTGIPSEDGTYYIYQRINRIGEPKGKPILYCCKCELELRENEVYVKDTNILVE